MMTTSSVLTKYYVFNSRIVSHILFWISYYILFSLLWASDGNYYFSFGLEFILLPIRISASYFTIYYLIPKYLLNDKLYQFIILYIATIIVAGVLQRIFIHFYYELLIIENTVPLFHPWQTIRAMVLINTTVLFLSAIKMWQHWYIEYHKNDKREEKLISIKSDKRTHLVRPSEIMYVEGLGNHVIFYLQDNKRLISYTTLKESLAMLPDNFFRIHKSFIINKDHISSYTNENVDIGGRIIPLGKKVRLEV